MTPDDTNGHNQARREALRAEHKNLGCNNTARKYGVNPYYISMVVNDPDYVPRSPEICRKLGLVYYRPIKPGKPRNLRRCTIYAGTPPDEVVAKLERIGHRVKYENT